MQVCLVVKLWCYKQLYNALKQYKRRGNKTNPTLWKINWAEYIIEYHSLIQFNGKYIDIRWVHEYRRDLTRQLRSYIWVANYAKPSAVWINMHKKETFCQHGKHSTLIQPLNKSMSFPSTSSKMLFFILLVRGRPLGTNCSLAQGKCICLFHQSTTNTPSVSPHWSAGKHMGGNGRVLPHAARVQ